MRTRTSPTSRRARGARVGRDDRAQLRRLGLRRRRSSRARASRAPSPARTSSPPVITCARSIAEEAFLTDPSLAPLMTGVTHARGHAAGRPARTSRTAWTSSRSSRPSAPAPPTPTRASRSTPKRSSARSSRKRRRKNVPVQAHAHGDEGAMAAVKAGVRSIEHGTYLSDATLRADEGDRAPSSFPPTPP